MLDSEMLKAFDEHRGEFKPYGLTCELWMPDLMRKPDRPHPDSSGYAE